MRTSHTVVVYECRSASQRKVNYIHEKGTVDEGNLDVEVLMGFMARGEERPVEAVFIL